MKRFIIVSMIFTLFSGCSLFKKKAPSVESDTKISNTEKSVSYETPFLDSSDAFYPIQETVEDIQEQMIELEARVLEYEARLYSPSISTDILKLVKVPQLKHEIELENGTLIQGNIIVENADEMLVQTQIGQLTIDKGHVVEIHELAPAEPQVVFVGDAIEEIYSDKRIYTGKVKNEGLRRADFARIIYHLWQEDTQPLYTDSSFVDGSTMVFRSGVITDTSIEPGETVEFKTIVLTPNADDVQYVTREIRWETVE
jgi:hypothetical protein